MIHPERRRKSKRIIDEIPFSDPPLPEKGCWNCLNFNGDFCTKDWNNMDECYKVAWRDERKPENYCEDWRLDETINMEEFL